MRRLWKSIQNCWPLCWKAERERMARRHAAEMNELRNRYKTLLGTSAACQREVEQLRMIVNRRTGKPAGVPGKPAPLRRAAK